jgi:hypothetical protein
VGDRHRDADAMTSLYGRRSECAALDGLLDRVRGGRSAVLVLRGEAGIGKTALLGYLTERAAGLSVARCMGVGCWPSRWDWSLLPEQCRRQRIRWRVYRICSCPSWMSIRLALCCHR